MKFEWMKVPEVLIPCEIVYRGTLQTVMLHHLSAADVDTADREYPLMSDGTPAEVETRALDRAAFLAVLALGPESFDARDIKDQMAELRRAGDGFSRTAILKIATTAYQASMLTPEKMEAAGKRVLPFGSSSAEGSTAP